MTVVADASCLIYLQRRGRLEEFLKCDRVVTTERIRQELIDIPLRKSLQTKGPELKALLGRSACEMRDFMERGMITVEAIDHRRYSKLLDSIKKDIAAMEGLEEHEVKADHTVVVLAIQVAERQGSTKVASIDKTVNKIIASISRERGLKVELIKL